MAWIALFAGVLAYVAHLHEALAISSWIDVEVSNHVQLPADRTDCAVPPGRSITKHPLLTNVKVPAIVAMTYSFFASLGLISPAEFSSRAIS